MQAYSINYEFKNKYGYLEKREALVDASSLKYAKKKLMRKHNVKRLTITDSHIIGYL